MALQWFLAQIPGSAERRALIALRQNKFVFYRPTETRLKAVPKGEPKRIEHPLFPGYLFVALGPAHGYDDFHKIDGMRIIPTTWPADRFAATVADMAFRQCAGEFDRTGTQTYLPSKPVAGPLATIVGHGLSALEKLKGADDQGRIVLLLGGEVIRGEPVEPLQQAA